MSKQSKNPVNANAKLGGRYCRNTACSAFCWVARVALTQQALPKTRKALSQQQKVPCWRRWGAGNAITQQAVPWWLGGKRCPVPAGIASIIGWRSLTRLAEPWDWPEGEIVPLGLKSLNAGLLLNSLTRLIEPWDWPGGEVVSLGLESLETGLRLM